MEQPVGQPAPAGEEKSIFNEEDFLATGHERHVKNARNTIFIVAIAEIVLGAVLFFRSGRRETIQAKEISLGLIVLISVVFFVLAFWSRQKPFAAILCALVLYTLLLIGDAWYDPSSLTDGIILKAFIIIYLIRGLKNAKEEKEWKKTLGR